MGQVISLSDVDLSKYEKSMVSRFGHTEEQRDEGFRQIKFILEDAQKHGPGRYYALPRAADWSLHVMLLDTMGMVRMSAALYGEGNLLAHDPFPPDGPAREEAWENTRNAFAAKGAELPTFEDSLKLGPFDPFGPEGCWLWVQPLAA